MGRAAKLLYGGMALVFTISGIYYLYASQYVGVDSWSWLGIRQYVWFGLLNLFFGVFWWYILLRRPDMIDGL